MKNFLNKPQKGKQKQQYIFEYDWKTYIFAIKKILREWKKFNNVDIEANRLIHGLYLQSFATYCLF